MSVIEAVALVLAIALLVVTVLVIVPWRQRRSRRQMIQAFREYDATSEENAITAEQLNIKRRSIFNLRARDFKKEALVSLIAIGAVQMTEDDRLYLSEENLISTKLDEPKSH